MDIKDREFLQRIQATFRIEAEEHLKSFSVYLNDLGKSETAQVRKEITESMFREIHSMKGAARSVGRKEMETVCQLLENLFSLIKQQKIELVPTMYDLFYKSIDILFKFVSVDGALQLDDDQQILNELSEQIQAFIPKAHDPMRAQDKQAQKKIVVVENLQVATSQPPTLNDFPKSVRLMNTEVVRIPISKLNPLLLQAEEFIQSKISFNQFTKEIKGILNEITELKSESQKLRERRIRLSAIQWNDWQTSHELRLTNLEDQLTKISHSMERNGYGFERLVYDHLDAIKQVLMLPVSSLTEAFPAMVREISRNLHKEVDFDIKGSELEMDKRILEELKDPLIHLIRNSIDHGLGNKEERLRYGKKPVGKITLSFIAKESGKIEIVLSDDGKGIDGDLVLKEAIKTGILTEDAAGRLNREETLSLIFQSGLSTSSIITDLSGHGLGLTIVREKVEKLSGRISVETKQNEGTIFRILLPITLTTFRGIMVRVAEQMFVVPTANVKMALRVKSDEITTVENHETVRVGGDILSLVSLAETLGIQERLTGASESQSADKLNSDFVRIVVLTYADLRLAFKVDEVLDEQQVLVKGLGRLLNRVRNISGATILGSGNIVPVLNIADLMKSGIHTSTSRKDPLGEEIVRLKSEKILIAEDSITSRTLLKNILETAGYQVTTAVDGLDAYTRTVSGDFALIISDVDMPRMNGFELTMKIRNDQKLNEIPIILITALESTEDRERGIESGANAYIIKSSFDQGNLLEVIKKLI